MHRKINLYLKIEKKQTAVLISLFQMLQPTHVAIIESWLGHMQWSNCCVQHHIWNDQCYLNVPGIPSDFHMVQHIYQNAPLVAKSDNLLLSISSFFRGAVGPPQYEDCYMCPQHKGKYSLSSNQRIPALFLIYCLTLK